MIRDMEGGKPHNFSNPKSFMEDYFACNFTDNNLLCVLYQHGILLFRQTKWNPNKMVGDVQLEAFTSFLMHQI